MNLLSKTKILVAGILLFSNILTAQDSQVIQLRPGPGEGYHSDIRNDNPAPNWQSINVIANAWTVGGFPFVQRSLLKFDLSQIPPDAIIIRANLSLFCNTSSGHYQLQSGDNAAQLRRITQPWDQFTANWSNQPSSTGEGAAMLPVSTSNTQDYPDIDITEMVIFWHQNPVDNFGMLLRLMEESQYRCMVFASSHHSDVSKRPLLEIEYTTCQKPLDFFRHTTQGLRADFHYTDTTTSSWLWDFGDNNTSTLQNPTHEFAHAGRYLVKLLATNPCDSIRIQDTITVCENPTADFSYSINDQIVSFKDLSLRPETWYWSFGNGFFSNLTNPVYDYMAAGAFRVCLMVTNLCGSSIHCRRLEINPTDNDQIYIEEPVVEVNPNPSSGPVAITTSADEMIYLINVYNTSGLLLKSFEPEHGQVIDLNLSELVDGTYLIGVETSQGYRSGMFIKY